VLAQDGGRELDELGAHDLEARFFEAINHSADMLLLHAVGFEDNERFLHKRLLKSLHPRMGSLILVRKCLIGR
jgi:hypothetical protein